MTDLNTNTSELYIPEFAHGYLLSLSYEIFSDVSDDDDWQQVEDVPLMAGEQPNYQDYDLNFWYSEEENKWHCTAYEVRLNEEGVAYTKTDEWRRLW